MHVLIDQQAEDTPASCCNVSSRLLGLSGFACRGPGLSLPTITWEQDPLRLGRLIAEAGIETRRTMGREPAKP